MFLGTCVNKYVVSMVPSDFFVPCLKKEADPALETSWFFKKKIVDEHFESSCFFKK